METLVYLPAEDMDKRQCCSRIHCPNGEFAHTVGRSIPYESARIDESHVKHRCIVKN